MALELNRQIEEAIKRSRHILLTFRPTTAGDGLSSALALGEVLQNLGKQVEIASDGYVPPLVFSFLPNLKTVKPALSPLQKFIIKVDISKNKLESLSYDVKNDELFIYVTPRAGLINKEDIKTASTDLKFDLIFILGSPDLESLGKIYDNNTELFYRTPTINIDNNPANEHFGKINAVDITASSTTEIIFEMLQQIHPEQLKANLATMLLTGLIIKTQSFRAPNISARTLHNASLLVELGADREMIVRNLYRTRSINTLKLWGQALASLKHDSKRGLVWLSLTRDNFRGAGSTEKDLPEIIDELIANSPEAKIIVLLYETDDGIHGLVHTHPSLEAKLLVRPFDPQGSKNRVSISVSNQDLAGAEVAVVEQIKKILDSGLGMKP